MTSINKLHCISGAGDESPPCYVLQVDEFRFLLDCGWDEKFDMEFINQLKRHVNSIDAVLLSHSDPLHLGALPYAVGKLGLNCPIYATLPIYKMGQMFMYDLYQSHRNVSEFDLFTLDDVDSAFDKITQLKYNQSIDMKGKGLGIRITPLPAGHSLGGTVWRIAAPGEEDIVYAPDFNHKKERHLNGCEIEKIMRPSLLLLGAMNADYVQQRRRLRDEKLMTTILSTLRGGGSVLVCSDTAGRVLELAHMLDQLWRNKDSGLVAYSLLLLSNVSYNVVEFAKSQIEWMSDKLTRAFEGARSNPFALRHLQLCHSVAEVTRTPGPKVVLASFPDLEVGFARDLFMLWAPHPQNSIILTARTSPGTLARELVERGGGRTLELSVGRRVRLEGDELAEFLQQQRLKQSSSVKYVPLATRTSPGTLARELVERGGGRTLELSVGRRVRLEGDELAEFLQQQRLKQSSSVKYVPLATRTSPGTLARELVERGGGRTLELSVGRRVRLEGDELAEFLQQQRLKQSSSVKYVPLATRTSPGTLARELVERGGGRTLELSVGRRVRLEGDELAEFLQQQRLKQSSSVKYVPLATRTSPGTLARELVERGGGRTLELSVGRRVRLEGDELAEFLQQQRLKQSSSVKYVPLATRTSPGTLARELVERGGGRTLELSVGRRVRLEGDELAEFLQQQRLKQSSSVKYVPLATRTSPGTLARELVERGGGRTLELSVGRRVRLEGDELAEFLQQQRLKQSSSVKYVPLATRTSPGTLARELVERGGGRTLELSVGRRVRLEGDELAEFLQQQRLKQSSSVKYVPLATRTSPGTLARELVERGGGRTLELSVGRRVRLEGDELAEFLQQQRLKQSSSVKYVPLATRTSPGTLARELVERGGGRTLELSVGRRVRLEGDELAEFLQQQRLKQSSSVKYVPLATRTSPGTLARELVERGGGRTLELSVGRRVRLEGDELAEFLQQQRLKQSSSVKYVPLATRTSPGTLARELVERGGGRTLELSVGRRVRLEGDELAEFLQQQRLKQSSSVKYVPLATRTSPGTLARELVERGGGRTLELSVGRRVRLEGDELAEFLQQQRLKQSSSVKYVPLATRTSPGTLARELVERGGGRTLELSVGRRVRLEGDELAEFLQQQRLKQSSSVKYVPLATRTSPGTLARELVERGGGRTLELSVGRRVRLEGDELAEFLQQQRLKQSSSVKYVPLATRTSPGTLARELVERGGGRTLELSVGRRVRLEGDELAEFLQQQRLKQSSSVKYVPLATRTSPGTLARELVERGGGRTLEVSVGRRVRLEGDELAEFLQQQRLKQSSSVKEEVSGLSSDSESDGELEMWVVTGRHDIPAHGAARAAGCFKANKRHHAMYPCHDERTRADDYGELIRPEDYRLAEIVDAEGEIRDVPPAPPLKEDPDEEMTEIPSKCIATTKQVTVAANIQYIELEGRCDGESLLRVVVHAKPRAVVGLRAGDSALQTLRKHCESEGIEKIFMPKRGDTIDATTESNIYQVKLTDSLMCGVAWRRAGDAELAWLSAVVAEPRARDAGHEESALDTVMSLEPAGAGAAPHAAAFINAVRLSELRAAIAKIGLNAEFSAGALECCNGTIAIRRLENGRVALEGVLSEEYFKVRELLYDQFAIV